MAAPHVWTYLWVLTLTHLFSTCMAADAGLIAGCTVGAVVVVALIVLIIILLIIRRKRRLGRKSFRQKPSMYENVSPHGTIISVRDSDTNVVCPEKKTEKPKIKKKPVIINRASSSGTDGTEHVNTGSAIRERNHANNNHSETNGETNGEKNVSTTIPVSRLREYIRKVRKDVKGFEKEYQKLPSGFKRSYTESQKEENKGKNKFTGYYPYDYNRVVLSSIPGDPSSTYINASYINGYKQKQFYIAAQAPKKRTLGDFWRMIWERKCGKIVMLTNLVEVMKTKCEPYWNVDSPLDVGNFLITVTKEAIRAHWTIRELTVKHKETKLTKSVLQFHFTAWPDHGVPHVTSLMEFVWRVRKTRSPQTGPLLVHCSAGIGRTGTFIAIDYLLEQGRAEGKVDVFGCVSTMRDQRKNMIQTKEQYECVHDSLLEEFSVGHTTLTCQEFSNKKEQDRVFSMGKCSIAEFVEMLNMERQNSSTDDEEKGRLWVTDKNDHFAIFVPSYVSLSGYIVSEVPSKTNTEPFWKMVDDQEPDVILLLPEASKHLARLCPVSGRSLDFDKICVCCSRQMKIDGATDCRDLQIRPKADSSALVDVKLYSSRHMVVKDLPELITSIETSRDPEVSRRSTVIVFGQKERNLAAMFCIISNVMEGISMDDEVEIYNNVRTTSHLLHPDITQSDVELLVEIISLYLPVSSLYANFSFV